MTARAIVREARTRGCRCNWRGGQRPLTSCGHDRQVTVVSWVVDGQRFTTRHEAQEWLDRHPCGTFAAGPRYEDVCTCGAHVSVHPEV